VRSCAFQKEVLPKDDRPKLTIVCRLFGASGQPWLWRQVVGLCGFRKELICWKRYNQDTQPIADWQEHVLSSDPAPYDGTGRWIYRCRAGFTGNFYASLGKEKRQLTTLLQQDPPAVILCYFGDIAMRLVHVAKRAGIPLVAYLHGDFLFRTNRWYRWSMLRCLSAFSAIIVVTSSERSWLIKHGVPAEKIEIIPCGVPTQTFRPISGRESRSVKFVMASRLVDEKGCHISIQAFSRVACDHLGAELAVFGDGPQREHLEQLTVKLGVRERVKFFGYVAEAQLAERMPLHDVFIQHSLVKEGSPVSIVEAMACGLPIIATPVGGIVDQVVSGENGILVKEGDTQRMAEAMSRLAGDAKLRKKMGKVGRDRAVTYYDSTQQMDRLHKILLSVASIPSEGAL
jgi:glycosyltransferase involved in cell wall biosynthesis